MTQAASAFRGPRIAWLVALALFLSGCRGLYPGRFQNGPKPQIPIPIPREQAKVTLPDYIIEPPDILRIEGFGLVPKSPYEIRVFDVVAISSDGLDEDDLTGEYTVQPDGTIPLGHNFGTIRALGKTREQLEAEILKRVKQSYREPSVWVNLVSIGAQQQITGEHLVSMDGKVNLGSYGRVRVVGMTIEEAQAAVQEHLAQYLDQPQISLDVVAYNSKVYFVVTQGAGLGDQVAILPARGNETVLDAIGQIQGLQSNSSTRMWIARPGFNEAGGDQILPIDWIAITQRGDISSNYQLMPGDRLYVSEDKMVAVDTMLAKVFSPMERIFGVTLLGTQTAQRIKFFNQFQGLGAGGF